jgi:hypothetical protein
MSSPTPANTLGNIRARKLRSDARTLREAALIAGDMDCPSLANSLARLAAARDREASVLTGVSTSPRYYPPKGSK